MGRWLLYAGDAFTLAFLTFIGFAAHRETDIDFLPRMGAIFVPMMLVWFLIAPWLGLFQPEITSNPRELWRPALTMLFTAPLAAVLRSLILNTPIIPIFVLVLSATFAFGIVGWRGLYYFLHHKMAK